MGECEAACSLPSYIVNLKVYAYQLLVRSFNLPHNLIDSKVCFKKFSKAEYDIPKTINQKNITKFSSYFESSE